MDDEPLALELLEDNIRQIPYMELVASCSNPLEAMEVMQKEKIDLLLLDIQMPGLTGLQFIQTLTEKPMVILITAYEKFAIDGFNLDVVDYLLKPVSFDRFVKACNKAKELHELKIKNGKSPGIENNFFFVNADYSLVKIDFKDIKWIEGLKDYIKIHLLSTNKPVVTRMSMKTVEEELPANKFVRIHKSYVVAISQITIIRKSTVFLGNIELPVGDIYRDSILTITGRNS